MSARVRTRWVAEEAHVLFLEPASTVHAGDLRNDRTRETLDRIRGPAARDLPPIAQKEDGRTPGPGLVDPIDTQRQLGSDVSI